MQNIISYVSNKNLIAFENASVNPVESLILAQISYYGYGEINKPVKIRDFKISFGTENLLANVFNKKENEELLDALLISPKWSEIKLIDHMNVIDNTEEFQFAASTFEIMPSLYYIGFSGTDYSFAGWKEDFNLSYMDQIPSQSAALNYSKRMLDTLSGKIYIGGHSKGGNLAEYVLYNIDEKYIDDIVRVDNFDGPGINFQGIDEGIFTQRKQILSKYIPENSIVGRIFESDNIHSNIVASKAMKILDHDPMTWRVSGYNFVYSTSTTRVSDFIKGTIDDFDYNVEGKLKKDVLEDLYQIVLNLEIENLAEFSSNLASNLLTLRRLIKKQPKEELDKINRVRQAFRRSLYENRPRIIRR